MAGGRFQSTVMTTDLISGVELRSSLVKASDFSTNRSMNVLGTGVSFLFCSQFLVVTEDCALVRF